MTITAAPNVPNPNSATFAADAYPFTQWMAALGPEIEAETARINGVGFGTYSASSTTSLAIGTGSKSLTIETGKSFAVGQPVVIASTAGPNNYMNGQVTSYNSGTGALVVNATTIGGSGTVAAWTISIASIVAGGGVSPDSIVVLTSGTSWTCPDGVTKVRMRMCGGGGNGNASSSVYDTGGSGGNGGSLEAVFAVVPATSYTYSIGSAGGNSTFTANAITYTAGGGSNGTPSLGGAGGTCSGTGAVLMDGQRGQCLAHTQGSHMLGGSMGDTVVGRYGTGGRGGCTSSEAGTSGAITLELYK